MSILIWLFLAAAAFAQIASSGATAPTCASELERVPTPHATAEDCLLGIGDAVHIEYGVDVTRPSVIGPDGTIALPLIGNVPAANLTGSQLASSVKLLLSKYLNHPVVTVTLLDHVKQRRYCVDGDVLQPGRYLLVKPITVLAAIEKAEGFKPAAHNHKISVLREDGAELSLDYNGLLKHPERNALFKTAIT